MDKIRTGLAAYGMSGRVFHAPFISTNPHFELTAVTERSKELSREKYPDACIVRSFEELIGLEGLDLVVINTPDSTHYEYARRALEAASMWLWRSLSLPPWQKLRSWWHLPQAGG